ncbi:hypothetical protein CO173_03595 [Candidatus Uhrbacteria bacterium CG_4_9_14_3_um_filter_41_35]|uniref:Uncharacterized protein n=1 Tax=Candidatus Uhrbacteria bacterium CG_4_9_14_3_um_filter_41_35 TaxID=1975034 RepID=A0A2M7XDY5_9BACT|nr:MAG: hypothetical protein COV92_02155 [Candidatus Uhrbacteria bacterium CG11_big_fil_rev_8_21_14_0_20_41_9]PJA46098.1 MAG: hypothetical protein CO173_03595 [Candidatus Uhrbacteria bacterium CG_4_9_14_3_um_filter_41_35]
MRGFRNKGRGEGNRRVVEENLVDVEEREIDNEREYNSSEAIEFSRDFYKDITLHGKDVERYINRHFSEKRYKNRENPEIEFRPIKSAQFPNKNPELLRFFVESMRTRQYQMLVLEDGTGFLINLGVDGDAGICRIDSTEFDKIQDLNKKLRIGKITYEEYDNLRRYGTRDGSSLTWDELAQKNKGKSIKDILQDTLQDNLQDEDEKQYRDAIKNPERILKFEASTGSGRTIYGNKDYLAVDFGKEGSYRFAARFFNGREILTEHNGHEYIGEYNEIGKIENLPFNGASITLAPKRVESDGQYDWTVPLDPTLAHRGRAPYVEGQEDVFSEPGDPDYNDLY